MSVCGLALGMGLGVVRAIQFDVENYNCSTHQYDNKKKNSKSICVVDTFTDTDMKRGQ